MNPLNKGSKILYMCRGVYYTDPRVGAALNRIGGPKMIREGGLKPFRVIPVVGERELSRYPKRF
jgi:hypothetical protein